MEAETEHREDITEESEKKENETQKKIERASKGVKRGRNSKYLKRKEIRLTLHIYTKSTGWPNETLSKHDFIQVIRDEKYIRTYVDEMIDEQEMPNLILRYEKN